MKTQAFAISLLLLVIASTCGCIQTGTKESSVNTLAGSVRIVEHTYLMGESTYDVYISVLGNSITKTGITQSEMNALVNSYKSSSQTTPASAPVQTPVSSRTKTVAATARQSGNDILVTWQGGQDNSMVSYFTVTANGGGGSNHYNPQVGFTLKGAGLGTSGPDHVVVTAFFTDGSSQVVLDTYV